MRPGQYLIRLVVFSCVALDPSSGGVGLALGVTIAVAIAFAGAGINAIRKTKDDEPGDADN